MDKKRPPFLFPGFCCILNSLYIPHPLYFFLQ